MDPEALRYVLTVDRAAMENTPLEEIRPAELQRWRIRVHRLAELEGRPVGVVLAELRDRAQFVASREREETLLELARDLAVARALGSAPAAPWRRRLLRLGAVMELPPEQLQQRIERRAARLDVVVERAVTGAEAVSPALG